MEIIKWFAQAPSTSAKLRLFCFPFAGGGGKAFKNWQDFFPSEVQVMPIVLPGRETRLMEETISNLPELVSRLLPALKQHLNVPFVFFGHSMGAKIAFECASALEKQNIRPKALVLSGSRAPHIPEPKPIHHLPPDEFKRELRRFGGTPEGILENDELMDFFIPILRADFTLDETYSRKPGEANVSCPLHVLYALDDPEAPEHDVLPWKHYATETYSTHSFNGGHFFFQNYVLEISKLVKEYLVKCAA